MKKIYFLIPVLAVLCFISLTQCKKSSIAPLEIETTKMENSNFAMDSVGLDSDSCFTDTIYIRDIAQRFFKIGCLSDTIKDSSDVRLIFAQDHSGRGLGDLYYDSKKKEDSIFNEYKKQYKDCIVTRKWIDVWHTQKFYYSGRKTTPRSWFPYTPATCFDHYRVKTWYKWKFSITVCCPTSNGTGTDKPNGNGQPPIIR